MSSGALDDVLTRHHVGLTSEEVVAELDAALSAIPAAGAAPLSTDETAFLRAHVDEAAEVIDAWDPDHARREAGRAATRQLTAAVASSYSVAETAELLGLDRSRISHRMRQQQLYSFPLGRHRRLPRWQFTPDGQILPGLPAVIAAIPAGLPPHTLEAFMHTPQPELEDHSPVAHLAAGGDPTAVAELLADLGRW